MPREIRRVVTGHNAEGKSAFIIDGPCPHVFRRGTGSVVVTDLWETHATPPDGSGRHEALDRGNPRHPGFHKTSSVDYAIVLSGEIYALMDEGEVLLKAGDVLIQRGTNHAWSNRTDEPAYLAFVLIDANP